MVFAERLPRQVCELWLEAIELFKARSWDDAKAKFVEAASASDALKGPVELYLNQIEMHVSAEPDSKWQGEIVFTSK